MKSSLKAGVEKPSEWVSAASMTSAVYKSAARRSTSHFLTAWPRGAHWGYHQLIPTTVCIARMTKHDDNGSLHRRATAMKVTFGLCA